MGPDEFTDQLAALERRLRADLASHATIERQTISPSRRTVSITPSEPEAMTIDWLELPYRVILHAGRAGRWELTHSRHSLERLEAIVSAVIAGRVTQTRAFRRWDVTVTLDDGRNDGSVAYDGLLTSITPIPGWRRWGRTIHHRPYR